MTPYDAIILVSFGGPEGPDDVLPFLENVLRGKNVPRERMLEVAEHYHQFGGVSPINQQNRELIAALKTEFQSHDIDLPIYFGNRNWHPLLTDTLREMANDGVKNAIAFFTSAYSSYSGCRQYRENIAAAQSEVGDHAPKIDRIRMFFNHPGYIETLADRLTAALDELPASDRDGATVLMTAHSIPMGMASNCQYVTQLNETGALVSKAVDHSDWELVYQSRSGPPQQPWLEPDVCDRIRELHSNRSIQNVVVFPIGFVSDHLEVMFDLDIEAKSLCDELGIRMVRAATAGTHPRFVQMVRELVEERVLDKSERPALGELGPVHDVCPEDCCRWEPPKRPIRPHVAGQ